MIYIAHAYLPKEQMWFEYTLTCQALFNEDTGIANTRTAWVHGMWHL
jgi:hypothetical protein